MGSQITLFLIVGVILLIAAAFFLWRKHTCPIPSETTESDEREHPAQPPATETMLPRMPGEKLHNGRYVLTNVISSETNLNIYEAQDTIPVRICPTCGARTQNLQERFCSNCGTDLSTVTLINSRLWLKETLDREAFINLEQLLTMKLSHPGLLLPIEVFSSQSQGQTRYYEVYTSKYPVPASLLPVPQSPQKVVPWVTTLARGLAYLHRHRVALQKVTIDNITTSGETARWIYLGQAKKLAPDETYDFEQEVQALVSILHYLLTGDLAETPLPQPLATCYEQLQHKAALTAEELADTLQSVQAHLDTPPGSLIFDLGLRSDVGMKRTLNEDSVLVLTQTSIVRSQSTPVGIFAVADGMGGHEAGEIASELTTQIIGQSGLRHILAPLAAGETSQESRYWVTQAALQANEAVLAQRQAVGNDMGCTLVLALIQGHRVTVANVGDSRAYLLSEDGIRQITTDHSWVERLVATGQITREESRHHPQKNIIYRVIGDHQPLSVDVFEEVLEPHQALLLCSDGLSGMVEDQRIWDLWHNSPSAQEACERLIDEANRAGGEDNISVVIVQVRG